MIARVSGRLLRYYDEIGLLIPEYTDPQSGYRYYSAAQLPRLNRILVAKELGFSLEQIARLMDQELTLEEMRGMLTLRKAQIERTMSEEAERLRVVESRLRQLEEYGTIQPPDVILKPIPAQGFLAIRELFPGMEAVRNLVQQLHATVPPLLGSNLGPIAVAVHSEIFDPEALDFEVGYLVDSPVAQTVRLSEDRLLTRRELPAVSTMATLVHAGPIYETHRQYGALGLWLEQNGWRITGRGRELLVQLPIQGKGSDAVVEIQLPVERV